MSNVKATCQNPQIQPYDPLALRDKGVTAQKRLQFCPRAGSEAESQTSTEPVGGSLHMQAKKPPMGVGGRGRDRYTSVLVCLPDVGRINNFSSHFKSSDVSKHTHTHIPKQDITVAQFPAGISFRARRGCTFAICAGEREAWGWWQGGEGTTERCGRRDAVIADRGLEKGEGKVVCSPPGQSGRYRFTVNLSIISNYGQ